MSKSDENILLKISNVSKFYPGVKALDDVSFTIKKGEVRALVGENGAGKSTLIRQIMGVEKPDAGKVEILTDGEWKTPGSALEAKKLGMHANYQHVNIARELSVAENYFLGNMPKTKLGTVNWKAVTARSRVILEKFKLSNVDPNEKIADLSVALQAMITISKISVNDVIRLVIFDEPTALLENDKVEVVFDYIRELKRQGVSVIYVSHRIEEIMDICDTVTVLKDGRYVDTKDVAELDKDKIISMMVGREVGNIYNIKHGTPGEELLRVENLSNQKDFKDVSFYVRQGEIVGFFGLVGAGRSEVMRAIYGDGRLTGGDIWWKGRKVHFRSVRQAMDAGIGLIPEDRAKEGLALPLSIKANINMGSYGKISKAGLISLKKEKENAESYRKSVGIKTPSIDQLVRNLSGGNQQKVVISKTLSQDSELFIFDEPTVGVDVGAKSEIFKIIESLVQAGKAVIVISSYLPEVMGLSDRIYVMSEGKITGEVDQEAMPHTKEEDFLRMASDIG